MSTSQSVDFFTKHEFLIRRLHSLSGLVPVGAYMVVHLLVNASILNGAGSFQQFVTRFTRWARSCQSWNGDSFSSLSFSTLSLECGSFTPVSPMSASISTRQIGDIRCKDGLASSLSFSSSCTSFICMVGSTENGGSPTLPSRWEWRTLDLITPQVRFLLP